MRVFAAAVVFCSVFFAGIVARAESPHSLTYRNVVVLQANPILARDILSVDYQYRIYESASPYLRNNYFGLAFRPTISPGFARIGGAFEFAPASVVRLGIGVEHLSYFGRFGQLQSFPEVDADYADSSLSAGREAGGEYSASGTSVFASLQAQNRFGPFIVRDLFEVHRTTLELQTGHAYYYEPTMDMLVPESGFSLTNDFDVLYISPFGLIVGARYTLTKAFYPGESDPNGPSHRLGPSFSYVVFQNPGAAFDSATLFVLLNWWVKHKYRTGDDVNAGVPFLSVGFSFTGSIF